MAIDALAALGQRTRLATFRLLMQRLPDGMEIARLMAAPQNTISAHLSVLARAGLVSSERRSRAIIYRAETKSIRALLVFLLNNACQANTDIIADIRAELEK